MLLRHWIFVWFVVGFGSRSAFACSVCMGANGGPLAEAYNGAIFLMLGVLLGVFSAIGYFMFRMVSRARTEGSM